MPYQKPDHYARKAKKEHYKARSVYKLQELDEKHGLFKAGQQVLDLGASPGSWSQYVSQRIGSKGRLLGIDLTAIDMQLPNALFVQEDIFEADFTSLFEQAGISPPLDAVISDMAPKTTGVKVTDQARSMGLCEMALHVAQQHLRPGGFFICKLFDGPDFQAFRAELQQAFSKVAIHRPKSTRKESKELFFVALGYRPGTS